MGEEKSIVLLSLGLHPAAASNTKPLYRIFPFPLSCLFSQIVLAFPSSQTFPISPKPDGRNGQDESQSHVGGNEECPLSEGSK
jgi:hypothetical protein